MVQKYVLHKSYQTGYKCKKYNPSLKHRENHLEVLFLAEELNFSFNLLMCLPLYNELVLFVKQLL